MESKVKNGTLTKEQKLLKFSVICASFLALTGILFGIFLDSQMILFDGFFSLISVGLSALTYMMSRYIQKRDDAQFPFGKNMIEPVVVVFKFTMIGLLCIFSIFTATKDLLVGGRDVIFDLATLYSLLALAICYWVYLHFKKQMYKHQSDLIRIEASEWYLDAVLSGVVLVGFLIAWAISFTEYKVIIPYVDPILVILASLYFMKVPVLGILRSGREMLGMAPEPEVRAKIIDIIRRIEQNYSISRSYIRATKAGKVIYVDVDFVVAKVSTIETIDQQDMIREEIFTGLKVMPYTWWLTVAFTKEEKWAL